jgi:hypothetical protein
MPGHSAKYLRPEPPGVPTNEQVSYLPLPVGEPTDPGNQQV